MWPCELARPFSLFSTVENACGNVEASYFLLFHTPCKGVEEWKRKDAAKKESRTGRTNELSNLDTCRLPILPPTFPPQVRWLALVMAVRLRMARQSLEHGRSIENAEGSDPVNSHSHGEIERKLLEVRSAKSLRLARFGREKLAICSFVAAPVSEASTWILKLSHGLTRKVRA
jgi:hypothetical protein